MQSPQANIESSSRKWWICEVAATCLVSFILYKVYIHGISHPITNYYVVILNLLIKLQTLLRRQLAKEHQKFVFFTLIRACEVLNLFFVHVRPTRSITTISEMMASEKMWQQSVL